MKMKMMMKLRIPGLLAALFIFAGGLPAAQAFRAAKCEGVQYRHIQGVTTNGRDAIYWSWTEALMKTDRDGKILAQVEVESHAGDLTFHAGKLYVAFNFGAFNQPPGAADSWVIVYDGETLQELERHAVPEVVHGAGGMAYHAGRFVIVGGLPEGVAENYLYVYDDQFNFISRHVLPTGYTRLGIQTIEYAAGAWWIGCHGAAQDQPRVLLRTDEAFQLNGRWDFSAELGIAWIGDGRFLVARNQGSRSRGYHGWVEVARIDPEHGLVVVEKYAPQE